MEVLRTSSPSDRDVPVDDYLAAAELVAEGIIERQRSVGRTVLAGVSGIDGVGKSRFAGVIEAVLLGRGVPTTIVHVDNFTHPTNRRHASHDRVENYYENTFDYETLVSQIFRPLHAGEPVNINLVHPSPQDDSVEVNHGYSISPQDGVVLVEGVFLFRPEVRDYLDYKALLTMPLNQMFTRLRVRDVPTLGKGVIDKVADKYLPAQQVYSDVVRPEQYADVILDFTDWSHPVQIGNLGGGE